MYIEQSKAIHRSKKTTQIREVRVSTSRQNHEQVVVIRADLVES